ncbi:MAG: hypothetical protein QNJ63_28865 [Calothrix sp. MO_192.B10]|nr:hypothetical protein [Calothrix sp. MO_192.B10]
MTQPTIENILGAGAKRLVADNSVPSSGLFIPDSALIVAGLSDPATATAQQYLAAIIINAQKFLNLEAFDTDTNRSIYIETELPTFINRGENNDRYQLNSLSINLAKLSPATSLKANDY